MIIINKKAEKYINSADSSTKQRLKTAIAKLPAFGNIKKLAGYDNFYRLRVGDLRVLFTYENENIIILDIKPRGQVYKGI